MWPVVTDQVAWSVGWSVGVSVCQSVTVLSPTKTATYRYAIWVWTRVGHRTNVLDGSLDLLIGKVNFGGKWRPVAKYSDALP